MKKDTVRINVEFLTLMKKYSKIDEIEIMVPNDLSRALDYIIDRFNIPWKGNLEKHGAILINGRHYQSLLKDGADLSEGSTIVFVPLLTGG